ncbi:MFS transporter, partial [Streptomyces tendae]
LCWSRTSSAYSTSRSGSRRWSSISRAASYSSAFGAREAVAGGGLLVVAVMLALAVAMPALRRYRV